MRIVRLELQAQLQAQRLDSALRAIEALTQALRASQLGSYSGGGGDGPAKVYYASSDGAAVGSGTWPTFSPGSFTSDVYDLSSGSPVLSESAATVYWYSLDALENAGAPVECVPLAGGGWLGLLEHCTAIPADEEE
jgi:hypothetical protein